MNRVLFVQPSLQPPGGGNILAAWILEALKVDYSLTVLTWEPVDLDAINRYSGTSLASNDLATIAVPDRYRVPFGAIPLPLGLLKDSLFMRFAERHFADHDLVVSAANETRLGRAGIQYVHYPRYDRPRPDVDMRWYHRPRRLLSAYYSLCDRIFSVTIEDVLRNLTLVNSDWTGEIFRAKYGGVPRTLYPPVAGSFPEVAWQERKNGFVCLGRIAPEKDLDTIIDIVAAVRGRHPDVHLHIIGSPGSSRYYQRIRRRIKANSSWITLHLNVDFAEVRRLIAENRYGIHAMPNEHFGMAPAEMAAGGCIVWVRDDGGQVEIVGRDPRLMFHSKRDAVDQILATMASASVQTSLRTMLRERVPLFSCDRFIGGIRAAVNEQLSGPGCR